jgi:hypothetical protein
MINQRISKIKVRRGTEFQRVSTTFEEGEVIYSVDKKRIFVGDDTTLGGVPVCNRNYIIESLGFPPILPSDILSGDIIFEKSTERTYITNWNGTEYELLLIEGINCCINLQNQINDLYTKLRTMTGCLSEPPAPPRPPSKLNWVVQPVDNYINLGETVTFSASAIGDGSISYVWRRLDSNAIDTSNIYKNLITISNVDIPDIATYYCVASNTVDSITSNYVDLDIETNSILSEEGERILSELNEFIFWEEI